MILSELITVFKNNIRQHTNVFSTSFPGTNVVFWENEVMKIKISGIEDLSLIFSVDEVLYMTGFKAIQNSVIACSRPYIEYPEKLLCTSYPHKFTKPSANQIKYSNLFEWNYVNFRPTPKIPPEVGYRFLIQDVLSSTQFVIETPGFTDVPVPTLVIEDDDTVFNNRHPFVVTGFETDVTENDTLILDVGIFEIPPGGLAYELLSLYKSPRITGTVSITKMIQSDETLNSQLVWGFFVNHPSISSRSRHVQGDALNEIAKDTTYRVRYLEQFSFFVIIPSTGSESGIEYSDLIETDIKPAVFRSILGTRISTGLSNDETWSQITPVSDGYNEFVSNNTRHIHEFKFERVVDISREDTARMDIETTAFREADLIINPDIGTDTINSTIYLP